MTTATSKERPIMFSGPMIRAIIAGRKSQTRRVVKPQPGMAYTFDRMEGARAILRDHLLATDVYVTSPMGAVGDRIWVRETFAAVPNSAGCEKYGAGFDPTRSSASQWREGAVFASEGYRYCATWEKSHGGLWKPAIHMPRVASRILLEITSIRLERLQDISEADAEAEGVERFPDSPYWKGALHPKKGVPKSRPTARDAFEDLWDGINEGRGYGWAVNPWVWVIGFKVVEFQGKRPEGPPAYAFKERRR